MNECAMERQREKANQYYSTWSSLDIFSTMNSLADKGVVNLRSLLSTP